MESSDINSSDASLTSSLTSSLGSSLSSSMTSSLSSSLTSSSLSSSMASGWQQPASSEQLIAEAYAAIASHGVHGQPSAPTGTPVSVAAPQKDGAKRQTSARQESRAETVVSTKTPPTLKTSRLSGTGTSEQTNLQPAPPRGRPVATSPSASPTSATPASARPTTTRPATAGPVAARPVTASRAAAARQATPNSPEPGALLPVTPIPVSSTNSPVETPIPPSRQTLTTGPSADTTTVPGAEGRPILQRHAHQQRRLQPEQTPQSQLGWSRMIIWIILFFILFLVPILRNLD